MACRRDRQHAYEGDRVLGGGWIEETVAAELWLLSLRQAGVGAAFPSA